MATPPLVGLRLLNASLTSSPRGYGRVTAQLLVSFWTNVIVLVQSIKLLIPSVCISQFDPR